jgi:uncharacterized protein (TIGR03437 family)
MAMRIPALVFCGAMLAGALALLNHPHSVHAQQTAHLQIASFSVSADQTLTYPNKPPMPYLDNLPDEHTTFIPPASSSSPYLVFAASKIAGGTGGAVVLQTTDLTTFTFATSLGYNPQVMAPPIDIMACNPAFDMEFDEGYAAPGSVVQDPTLPSGNLMMLYEAENHCPGGVNQLPYYATVGFARSADNGKTWPAPANGPLGSAARHPVLQSNEPQPSAAHPPIGDAIPSAFVDKSLDGNSYLYVTYEFHSDMGAADGLVRVARAQLGQDPLTFLKWYAGSFNQPGIGGLDTGMTPTTGCGNGLQDHPQISFNDDLGLYLLTFACQANSTAAWYYSTATSLDLQDWTTPQMIANSQYPVTKPCNAAETGGNQFDGWYPSFMSPGAAAGHTKLTGMVFFQNGCETGARVFASRTFSITTQPQPAPVLAQGSLANGATYVTGGLVPGSWAQVQGTGLANVTRIWTGFDFLNLAANALPTSLSGVQVMVNNLPASVYYISPTQINFQVPTGVTGTASVQVINNGTMSNTVTAASAPSAPGLFPNKVNGVNYPAAIAAGSLFVGPAGVPGYTPVSPGFHVELYATGLLSTLGGVIPTAQNIDGVTVTIGTVTVPADYAAQTPYVGEFQINFTVPQQFATMPTGNYPLSISLNGVSSPTTINSSPPAQIVLPVTP